MKKSKWFWFIFWLAFGSGFIIASWVSWFIPGAYALGTAQAGVGIACCAMARIELLEK